MKTDIRKLNHHLILVWIIIYSLATTLFFAPVFVNLAVIKSFSWVIIGITFLLSFPFTLKNKFSDSKYGNILKIWMFLLLISIINAFFQHQQGLFFSIRVILMVIPISFYFFLVQNKITFKEIEKITWGLFVIYIVIYFIAFISVPQVVFDHTGGISELNMQRGIARIKLLGSGFLLMGYFLSLNKWIIYKKVKYLLLGLLSFTIIILWVSRQHIFFALLLGLLLILNNSKLSTKILILSIICSAFVISLKYSEILQTLIILTQNQIESAGTNNIRILAFQYFTFDYNTNIFQLLIGNGIPHFNSKWGKELSTFSENNGFYLSDVGLVKIYIFWGIAGILSYLYIIYKVLRHKVEKSKLFAKYFILFIACTTVISHSFFLDIFSLSLALYILEIKPEVKV